MSERGGISLLVRNVSHRLRYVAGLFSLSADILFHVCVCVLPVLPVRREFLNVVCSNDAADQRTSAKSLSSTDKCGTCTFPRTSTQSTSCRSWSVAFRSAIELLGSAGGRGVVTDVVLDAGSPKALRLSSSTANTKPTTRVAI